MKTTKVKRKINKKALLVIILTLYLIIMAFYMYLTLPIKNIVINGNKQISDDIIISTAGIKDYPKINKVSKKSIIKNLESIGEIENVKVKKSVFGKITINVEELNVLFYNVLNKTYVLSNGKEVSEIHNQMGIPILVNYTQSDIYESLIKKMAKIDSNIISLISEIEYSPDIKDGKSLDNNRFLFRMNDGNLVYINLAHFDNINNYELIYAALEEKGVLKLDLIYNGGTNISFKPFRLIEKEQKEQKEQEEKDKKESEE